MILALLRLGLIELHRGRFPLLALLIFAAALTAAGGAGALLLAERQALQTGVLASLLRHGAIALLGLHVIASQLREQHTGTSALLLTLEAPRTHYVIGKLGVCALAAAGLAVPAGLLLLLHGDSAGTLRWTLSLWCELFLVAGVALVLTFTLRGVVTAAAALGGFYVLARAQGALELLAADTAVVASSFGHGIATVVLHAVAWALPDLWRFTAAEWPARGGGDGADLALVLGQTAIYGLLLFAAAAADLYRRAF